MKQVYLVGFVKCYVCTGCSRASGVGGTVNISVNKARKPGVMTGLAASILF